MTPGDQAAAPVRVFIEAGRRRVFASALDWPGWSRSGRTEELAIAALTDYLPRYALVVRRAGLAEPQAANGIAVVERSPGASAQADFGALGTPATIEYQPLAAADGQRLAALLHAAWAELADAAAQAPAVLPKGPRGGGRDTAGIIAHVVETDLMHAAKLGLRPGKVENDDLAAVAGLHALMAAAVSQGSGRTPADSRNWLLGYTVRRTAWHALDHAWELQDKSGSGR